MLRTRCLWLLQILMKTEIPTHHPHQTNHTTSSYPSLLHVTHDISSDGAFVGERDRNVGWPHGQHYSAGEEEAVSTRLTFPPTIWQQVRKSFIIDHLCRWARSTSSDSVLFKVFGLGLMMNPRFFSCLFVVVAQKVARSSAEADWSGFKLWPLLAVQVSSESESGKHQSLKFLLDLLPRAGLKSRLTVGEWLFLTLGSCIWFPTCWLRCCHSVRVFF